MVYRITELPYGLLRRMNQMASPRNRLYLQIAANEVTICPPEVQTVHRTDDTIEFRVDNGVLQAFLQLDPKSRTRLDLGPSVLIRPESAVVFRGLQFDDLYSPIFQHFLLCPNKIYFVDCENSAAFYHRVSKLTFESVEELFIFTVGRISFEPIFEAFPDTVSLFLPALLPTGWVKDVVKHQKKPLKKMVIFGTPKSVGGFTHQELRALFKKQGKDFEMQLDFWEHTVSYLKDVKNKLNMCFKRVKKDRQHLGRLSLTYNDVLHTFY